MSDCYERVSDASYNNRKCDFDTDMILWVLIIIVIVSCMCNN